MSKKFILIFSFITIVIIVIAFSCNSKEEKKETQTTGKVNILVDESVFPIIEDQKLVFESEYDKAKLNLLPMSELEGLDNFLKQKNEVIVLSRILNKQEQAFFKSKKIKPFQTAVAIDGLALIKSKTDRDTLVDLAEIINFIQKKPSTLKGLVFDNPNSSSVRFFKELAKVEEIPTENVYSFKTNAEVIKYVSENKGLIGVVGMNWLTQPTPEMQNDVDKVSVLSIKNAKNEYVYPTQENIGTLKYPLARHLYIINCQGSYGLGLGFSAFISSEVGQRIILKSGIAPVRMPSRKLVLRKNI